MTSSNHSFTDLKKQFPIFEGALKGWAFLDNASTTQKPVSVIEAITDFYASKNANTHRGLYELSSNATVAYENVRSKVKDLIGAQADKEIAFTSGTTESINVVANSFDALVEKGDNIVVTEMEHHANLIPWQQLCKRKKALLRVISVNSQGDLFLDNAASLIDERTRIVAVTHISNMLGTINSIEEIVALAHQHQVPVLVDAAQSVGHYPINVHKHDIDFLVFSAHKMFGPMGTGVLYAREKFHSLIQPLRFGGGAIKEVTLSETRFQDYPHAIEAGTPHVAGVMGLGAAIDFINQIDLTASSKYVQDLASTLREKLKFLDFIKTIGSPKKTGGIVPFIVNEIHAHDVAGYLADLKIAVRAGHHCTEPLHSQFGIPATVRASLTIYNSLDDVDKLVDGLKEVKKFWS